MCYDLYSLLVFPRLIKEKAMYEKEAVQQEAKIAKLKEEGKDEYVIKKQVSLQGWVCLHTE